MITKMIVVAVTTVAFGAAMLAAGYAAARTIGTINHQQRGQEEAARAGETADASGRMTPRRTTPPGQKEGPRKPGGRPPDG